MAAILEAAVGSPLLAVETGRCNKEEDALFADCKIGGIRCPAFDGGFEAEGGLWENIEEEEALGGASLVGNCCPIGRSGARGLATDVTQQIRRADRSPSALTQRTFRHKVISNSRQFIQIF